VTDSYSRRQSELSDRYAFKCACSKCKKGPTLQEDQFLLPLNEISPQSLKEIIANTNQYLTESGSHVPADAPAEFVTKAIEDYAIKLIEQCSKETPSRAVERLRGGLELLANTKIWPVHRQPFPALRHELFVSCLTNNNYMVAFFQGLKAFFDIDPILYSQTHHPTRVEHIWTLAKLTLFLVTDHDQPGVDEIKLVQTAEQMGMDIPYLMYGLMAWASDNVEKSHGAQSSFTKTVKHKFYQTTVDMTRGEAVDFRALHKRFHSSLPFWKAMAVKHTKGTVLPFSVDTSAEERGAF
jgi:hypothetical protein